MNRWEVLNSDSSEWIVFVDIKHKWTCSCAVYTVTIEPETKRDRLVELKVKQCTTWYIVIGVELTIFELYITRTTQDICADVADEWRWLIGEHVYVK